MHDKLQPMTGALFALPDLRVITLEGRDAAAFAQAQFINDVNDLQPDSWQWSGWLTPKGRLIALFALLKRSDEQVWLVVPDADPVELADSLKRFLFRSKVTIGVRDDLYVTGAFARPEEASGNLATRHNEGVEFDFGSASAPRRLIIGTASAPDDHAAVTSWKLADLEHGLPRLAAGQFGQWTPQQLSLERLRGFSVRKGCYPGQEIVARTHFLGKAKRGLALIESDAPIPGGAEVLASGKVLGSAIATVDTGDCHVALAVLPLDREPAPLLVGGAEVRERALQEGLSR